VNNYILGFIYFSFMKKEDKKNPAQTGFKRRVMQIYPSAINGLSKFSNPLLQANDQAH